MAEQTGCKILNISQWPPARHEQKLFLRREKKKKIYTATGGNKRLCSRR